MGLLVKINIFSLLSVLNPPLPPANGGLMLRVILNFHFFSGMKRNETKKNPARINSLGRGMMFPFQNSF